MKRLFNTKMIKLSLDGGFTCPNRDGTIGFRGCIFCGEEGAGEFTSKSTLDIKTQLECQKEIMRRKWRNGKYIAYFQNFTNTYSSIEDLREKYEEAIEDKDVLALSIATRPDCLSEDVLSLLEEISKKTLLWLELGLQTIHKRSADFIRRGYPLECYEEAVRSLKSRGIRVVTHLIFGLPGEDREDMLESVRYVSSLPSWGIKFHLLYIQKDTDLFDYYKKTRFHILSKEEYVSLVVDSIEKLRPDMVVHRLTGDGKRSLLVEPIWSLDKLRVLSEIDMELKRRNSFQGKRIDS